MQKGAKFRIQEAGFRKQGESILSTLSFPQRPPSARRRGFSLVEILVATTLLLIITVVISMVFQQAGGAWASGTGRAKVEGGVRAVMGSVERDLLNAVDARDYGLDNPTEGASPTLQFVALQHLYDHKNPRQSGRTPCLIDYRFSANAVIRYMAPLMYGGKKATAWSENGASPYATESTVNGGIPLTRVEFTCFKRGADPDGLPLRVEITAEASHSSSFFTIGGRSSGVNKKFEAWDEKKSDDIRVGGKL